MVRQDKRKESILTIKQLPLGHAPEILPGVACNVVGKACTVVEAVDAQLGALALLGAVNKPPRIACIAVQFQIELFQFLFRGDGFQARLS